MQLKETDISLYFIPKVFLGFQKWTKKMSKIEKGKYFMDFSVGAEHKKN